MDRVIHTRTVKFSFSVDNSVNTAAPQEMI